MPAPTDGPSREVGDFFDRHASSVTFPVPPKLVTRRRK
jgi:hypothetical protein